MQFIYLMFWSRQNLDFYIRSNTKSEYMCAQIVEKADFVIVVRVLNISQSYHTLFVQISVSYEPGIVPLRSTEKINQPVGQCFGIYSTLLSKRMRK